MNFGNSIVSRCWCWLWTQNTPGICSRHSSNPNNCKVEAIRVGVIPPSPTGCRARSRRPEPVAVRQNISWAPEQCTISPLTIWGYLSQTATKAAVATLQSCCEGASVSESDEQKWQVRFRAGEYGLCCKNAHARVLLTEERCSGTSRYPVPPWHCHVKPSSLMHLSTIPIQHMCDISLSISSRLTRFLQLLMHVPAAPQLCQLHWLPIMHVLVLSLRVGPSVEELFRRGIEWDGTE